MFLQSEYKIKYITCWVLLSWQIGTDKYIPHYHPWLLWWNSFSSCVPLITWKLHTFYAWHILHSFSKRLWRERKKKHLSVFSPFTAAIDHLLSNQSCFMGPLFFHYCCNQVAAERHCTHKKIWWRFLGVFLGS